jgi:hypothetical protein
MTDRKSVALFGYLAQDDRVTSILEAIGLMVTERSPLALPPSEAPAADITIVFGDSTTVSELSDKVVETFGSPRALFYSPSDLSAEALSALGHRFDLVGIFDSDARLETLLRAAAAEFSSESIAATVAGASLADRASSVDTLGFAPYVHAVGEFLLNEGTQPPLTMSVEGTWGSGKSSFMLQLADYLRARNGLIVEFNAWRHEKAEELWAAFAIQFVRGLKRARKSRIDRFRREVRLAIRRFDWRRGGVTFVRAALLLVAMVFATIAIPVVAWIAGAEGVQKALADPKNATGLTGWMTAVVAIACGAGAGAAWLSAAIPLWRAVTKELRNPLAVDLKQYVRAPDYEAKVAFLDRFHEDLDRVIGAYTDEGQKIFVFVDDLDRCEVPHAAELMQAINLMLADHGPLVFILGMDREKVAAGLAVKHEKLLPYLSVDAPFGDRAADPLRGLAFGYNFIEKFIQIPFVIPEPADADIETLLKAHTQDATTAQAPPRTSRAGIPAPVTAFPNNALATAPRTYVTLDLGTDDPVVIAIARMVAPALDRNPRRIKNFINLFRLRALIADATGLFRAASVSRSKRLTLRKLGKFVAIELRWPLLLTQLEQAPSLIADVERFALSGVIPPDAGPRLSYWSREPLLVQLLRAGCVTEAGERDEAGIAECGLGRIDLLRLLRVAPATKWRATLPTAGLDPELLKAAQRRPGTIVINKADYVDERETIPVMLSLTPDTLYYENPDLEASFEIARIDEIEYDDITTSKVMPPKNGRVLRLRSHGATFEFVMERIAARNWEAALPARQVIF